EQPPRAGRGPGPFEFTALIALAMALVALGIDVMLPALDLIRADLGLAPSATEAQRIITSYFIGLAVGGLAYGPLADRFGRKPVLYLGCAVYGLGALVSAAVPSLTTLVLARFLWGLGAAAPRVISVAIVRDTFEGERMARAMS